MSTPVTYVANQYNIPAYQDTGYAQGSGNLSSYLIALATGSLTLSGGTFTLTADTDFGANFGLKSLYYKSRNASVASTGIIRLGSAEMICWKDAGGVNDLELTTNASDQLTYNGFVIATSTGALAGTTLTLSATSNQMVIGTTNTTTVSFTAPAASRVYTFPDAGGNVEVVLGGGIQTIAGAKTFSTAVTINPTTNQLVLGTTRTVTLTAPTPASLSRVVTIPDLSGDYSLIGTIGTQTITGAKTFADQTLLLQETGGTDVVTINVASLAASRAYTVPDAGASASFVMTAGSQSIAGTKTFTASSLVSASSGGADLSFTVTNGSNTASSQSVFTATVAGASAGDAVYQAIVSGTTNWSWGLDNSASDAWVLSGSTALGTNNAISVSSTNYAVSILGTNTNDNASAGFVGEVISSTISASTPVSSGTTYDATSISLTAGDWEIDLVANAYNNTATWSSAQIGVSTTSGNSLTGVTTGVNGQTATFASSNTAQIEVPLTVAGYRVQLTGTTTHYFKVRLIYTVNTPQIQAGIIKARRAR